MKNIFSLILSLLAIQAIAQPPSYQWHNSANYLSTVTKVDNQGNIITAGLFTGIVDFDPSATGTFTLNSANGGLFITKLDASGNFIDARNFGSSSIYKEENNVTDICFTSSNNYVLTGYFLGTADFDPSPVGTSTLFCGTNNTNAFVLNVYDDLDLQSTFAIGGSGVSNNDYSNSIACNTNDEIVITGFTQNYSPGFIDFDPSASVATPVTYGGIFVAKYTSSGIYQWSQIYGGTGTLLKEGKAVFSNSTNNDILVMGSCSGNPDFDFSASTYTVPSSNVVSVFYLKLNTNGGFISANTISGNSNVELSHASASNDFSNIMTIVRSWGNNCDTDPNATNTSTISLPILSQGALFTQKLNSSLNLVWAKVISGQGNATCLATANRNYTFSGRVVQRYNNFGGILWSYSLSNNNGIFGKSLFTTNTTNLFLTGVLEFNPINYNPMATTPVATEQGTSIAKTFLTKWEETGNNGFYISGALITPTIVCLNEQANVLVSTIGNGTLSITGLTDATTGLPRVINNGQYFPVNDGVNTYPNANGYYPVEISYTNGTNTITLPTQYILVHPTVTAIATPTLQLANPQVGQYDNKILLPYPNNGTYTWLSCPSYSMVSNQPNSSSSQQYTLTQSGSYAAYFQNSNTGCKSDTTICVSFTASSVGLKELSESIFSIYPNPANEVLNIELENLNETATISIINALGEVVVNETATNKNLKLNIQHLTSGVYFIKMDNKQGTTTKKFIKQ